MSMSDHPIIPDTAPSVLIGASWQEQDDTLRDLWMQNKTPQEISDRLGRSIPAIMTRAARLGLPRRAAPGRKPGVSSARRGPPYGDNTITMSRRAAEPQADAEREVMPQLSLRICLMCLRKFESAGRHNRICAPCKGSAEYGQASSLPDIHMPTG